MFAEKVRSTITIMAFAIVAYAIPIVRVLGILVGILLFIMAFWAFSCLWMLMPEVRL